MFFLHSVVFGWWLVIEHDSTESHANANLRTLFRVEISLCSNLHHSASKTGRSLRAWAGGVRSQVEEMRSPQTADHHAVFYMALFGFKSISLKLWAGDSWCDGESVSLFYNSFQRLVGCEVCKCIYMDFVRMVCVCVCAQITSIWAESHCALMPHKGQGCWSVLLINREPRHWHAAVSAESNGISLGLFYLFLLMKAQSDTFKAPHWASHSLNLLWPRGSIALITFGV